MCVHPNPNLDPTPLPDPDPNPDPNPNPNPNQVRLTYSVELSPRLWVPVALLEGKIAEALGDNLVAIRNHVAGGGAAAGDVPAGG